jgi:hypothetical protein
VTEFATPDVDRQLPRGDEVFLDHVGHFVHDPQAASRALVRAGFTPTMLSVQRNPDGGLTGTGNVCAMFSRGYVECLFKTEETPLGRELDAGIARYPGIHLAAFAVEDAVKAHARLGDTGFRVRPLVEMQRSVATETGSATAAFTLARVEPGEMAEGRTQMLTHHTEDAVWQPRWLGHRNGALGLTSLVIAVADVAEAAARLARFTSRPAATTSFGLTIALDRGRIDLVTPEAFAAAVPGIAIPSLPFMGACGIEVASLSGAEAILRASDFQTAIANRQLIVPFPDELGQGAWLFVERMQ